MPNSILIEVEHDSVPFSHCLADEKERVRRSSTLLCGLHLSHFMIRVKAQMVTLLDGFCLRVDPNSFSEPIALSFSSPHARCENYTPDDGTCIMSCYVAPTMMAIQHQRTSAAHNEHTWKQKYSDTKTCERTVCDNAGISKRCGTDACQQTPATTECPSHRSGRQNERVSIAACRRRQHRACKLETPSKKGCHAFGIPAIDSNMSSESQGRSEI